MSSLVWRSLRLVLPSVWLGLIIAIDLLEAPLKFQAPGITIPLGLGIGRLVFLAMNITELVLAVLLALALWRSRATRRTWQVFAGIAVLLLVKVAIIRPLLAQHTNEVLAGGEGGSLAHVFYIGVDALLFLALLWFVAVQARLLLRDPNDVGGAR